MDAALAREDADNTSLLPANPLIRQLATVWIRSPFGDTGDSSTISLLNSVAVGTLFWWNLIEKVEARA